MKYQIHWFKPVDFDTEWKYFGVENDLDTNVVVENITAHFADSKLFVAFTRQTSFEVEKPNVLKIN